MGICVSCEAADEEGGATTARVVLPGGELLEYSPPVTASLVVQEVGGEGWFLCDADAMGLEGAVTAAVGAGEGLRPGQIYFVLPVEMRRRCLTREEVAALAVKASSALVKAAATTPFRRRRRRGAAAPLVFPLPEEEYAAAAEPMPLTVKTTAAMVRQKRRAVTTTRRGGRAATRFSPDLTAIPETE